MTMEATLRERNSGSGTATVTLMDAGAQMPCAVMVALPGATAVRLPSAATSAMEGSELLQETP